MKTVTNVTHTTVMKELRNTNGVKLLAIKDNNGSFGFALSSKQDSKVTRNGEECNQINLDNHRLWAPVVFKKIKAKYETTELFFDAVTDMMAV